MLVSIDIRGALPIKFPLFQELRRRHVVKNALLYVVTSWLMLQAGDLLFPALNVQEWAFPLLLGLLLLFFVPALIFSWVYEMTPDGLKREKDVAHDSREMIASGIKINKVIAVLLMLAIVVVAVDRLLPESAVYLNASVCGEDTTLFGSEGALAEPTASGRPPAKSVAVFPFINRSNDPGDEHFSASLAEQVSNLLARVPEFQVTSRTSLFASREQGAEVASLAHALNVAAILEGSVQHEDGQLRVTAQLIDARSDRLLWSGTYDRPLGQSFLAQDDIALAIVDGVKDTLVTELLPAGENGISAVGSGTVPQICRTIPSRHRVSGWRMTGKGPGEKRSNLESAVPRVTFPPLAGAFGVRVREPVSPGSRPRSG